MKYAFRPYSPIFPSARRSRAAASLRTPQDEGLAGLGRHGRDRAGELAQLVPIDRMLLGRSRILGRIQPFEVVDGVDRHDPRPADMTDDDRSRDLEQIGPRMADGVDGLELGQDGIGFLDDVVGIKPPARAPDSHPLSAGSCGRIVRRNQRVLSRSVAFIPYPLAGHSSACGQPFRRPDGGASPRPSLARNCDTQASDAPVDGRPEPLPAVAAPPPSPDGWLLRVARPAHRREISALP